MSKWEDEELEELLRETEEYLSGYQDNSVMSIVFILLLMIIPILVVVLLTT